MPMACVSNTVYHLVTTLSKKIEKLSLSRNLCQNIKYSMDSTCLSANSLGCLLSKMGSFGGVLNCPGILCTTFRSLCHTSPTLLTTWRQSPFWHLFFTWKSFFFLQENYFEPPNIIYFFKANALQIKMVGVSFFFFTQYLRSDFSNAFFGEKTHFFKF